MTPNSKSSYYFIGITFFLCGFLCGGLFIVFPSVERSFLEAKVTDYASIITTIMVGIGATYYINRAIGKNAHVAAVVEKLADKIEINLEELHLLVADYITDDRQFDRISMKNEILLSFKKISNACSCLEENMHFSNVLGGELRGAFIEYKKSVTDNPFGINGELYAENLKQQIEEALFRVELLLSKIKFAAYR